MAVTGTCFGPGKCCQTGRLGSRGSPAAGVGLEGGLAEAAEALADGPGEAVPEGSGEGLNTSGVSVTTGVGRPPRQAASKAQPKRPASHSRRFALHRNPIQLETIEEIALR
jgi:hypothetical protein